MSYLFTNGRPPYHINFSQGLPVMILFISFIILAFYNFWTLAKFKNIFYFIISLEVLEYILMNLTNAFSFYSDLGLLLAIFLGTGVAVYQKNIDMNSVIINE